MTTTTNYGLKKPSYTDPADINDLNYNSDTIDTALHSLETGKEALTNKSQDVATDAADTDKYPSTKAVADYVAAQIEDKIDEPSSAGTEGQVLTLDSNLDPVWANSSGSLPAGTNNGDILVWNGSAWVAQAKPSRLPAGYQEVEYIESTGTQYINTGVGINQNSKWMVDVSFDSAHNDVFQCMGAAIDGGASSTLRVNSSTSGNNFEVQLGTIVQTNTNRNNRTRVLLDNNTAKVYCDEILNVTGTVATTSKSNAYLFARNRPGSMANCYAKLYRAKYWELVNSVWTTVADFIPCYRVSDNEIGLYDIANNAFLVNNGTGDFICGNPV